MAERPNSKRPQRRQIAVEFLAENGPQTLLTIADYLGILGNQATRILNQYECFERLTPRGKCPVVWGLVGQILDDTPPEVLGPYRHWWQYLDSVT